MLPIIEPIKVGILIGMVSYAVTVPLVIVQVRFAGHYSLFTSRAKQFLLEVVVGPTIEELIFRYALITFFVAHLGLSSIISILLSAVLFGLAHRWYMMIPATITGALYGYCFIYYGIIAAVVAHMTHNFFASVW